MGCDIHIYIEYTHGEWDQFIHSFGGRINPGRNYNIFTCLAGVRRYDSQEKFIPPRGLPPNLGFQSRGDEFLYILPQETKEEGCCSAAIAERWVQSGSSRYTDDKKFVTHPDHHSHSWLTLAEFSGAIARAGGDFRYRAVAAAMAEFERNSCKTRVVFWFDN